MKYATSDELYRRLGDLYRSLYVTIDGQDMAAEADEDLVAASAEINGMIGSRYTVPIESPDALALLKSWCLTLAAELAWNRSGKPDFPETLKPQLAHVRDLLGKINRAEMTLPGAEENADGVIVVTTSDPVFGRERMEGF